MDKKKAAKTNCLVENQSVFTGKEGGAFSRDPQSFSDYPDVLNLPSLSQWLNDLKITFISSVEWICPAEWVLGPRRVAEAMLFLFHAGHGTGQVENECFEICAGDIMLIPAGAQHQVRQDIGTQMHVTTLHFYAHVFGGINVLDLLGFPVHIRPELPRDQMLHSIAEPLNRDFAIQPPAYRQTSASVLTQFLIHLVRHFGTAFKPPHKFEHIQHLRRLLPAFVYLENNIADGSISITRMAKKVFLSEVQFRKLFRRVTGMNPTLYIQSRRIDRACQLLRETTATLDEVSRDCGFNDAAFFCRVFKAKMAKTPTQFRHEPKEL